MPLQSGDQFPQDVKFYYIPYTEDKAEITACGIRQTLEPWKEWLDKRVALFAVPGAFTPGCQNVHLAGVIQHRGELKKKGVDVIAVIASDSAHVMAAWGKANNVRNNDILFLSDPGSKFSKSIGWASGENGQKAARYAIAIDKGLVLYAGKDESGKFDNSSAETVLAKL